MILKSVPGPLALVADSGGTKTAWACVDEQGRAFDIVTGGMSPVHLTAGQMRAVLVQQLLPQLPAEPVAVRDVFFYGSGCTPQMSPLVADVLRQVFTAATRVEVEGDLLGAARALFGRQQGIACILGTGSNSGLYDGERIIANTPPLGYILGDEGSGAALGRLFLNASLKGRLPQSLLNSEGGFGAYSYAEIINRVYRQSGANHFLASLAPAIRALVDTCPQVRELVVDSFRQFFQKNLTPYGHTSPVSFVGSIAAHFEETLREAALAEGYQVQTILRAPIKGLVDYHRLH